MKSNAQFRAFALIAMGLIGMGTYQVALHLGHPAIMEKDFFRGVWTGICIGLEVTGVYLLFKNRSRPAA